ncbi:hypothetical protein [Maricaulis sp.]|uniref:hypothetical protein n=1 Tax=Maricaulis sp. TaxID=1486257 RepID=UPI003A94937E
MKRDYSTPTGASEPTEHSSPGGPSAARAAGKVGSKEIFVAGEPIMLLEHTPDFSPMRRVVTGRRKRPTGVFFSQKAKRHLQYESGAERTGLLFAEFRDDVINMATQPVKLSWRSKGHTYWYTPDRIEFCDGPTRIIEVKFSRNDVEEADVERWRQAAKGFEALGWEFRVEFASELKRSSRYAAVCEIVYYSCTPVSESQITRVLACFDTPRRCLRLKALESALGSPSQTKAIVAALVVRRVLKIRPISPIGPDTLVWLGKGGRS